MVSQSPTGQAPQVQHRGVRGCQASFDTVDRLRATVHAVPGADGLVRLAATGGVITSAGIVLAGTFAALGTLPLVFVTEIGFAVAFGVLLDTFVVRSVLVTALNLDIGRWIWWPSSLHHRHDLDLNQLQQQTAAVPR